MTEHVTRLGLLQIGHGQPLALIAGPCVIESREHTLRMADAIGRLCRQRQIPFVFKASFDKANRSSIDSFRGPGPTDGLPILAEVRRELDIPVLCDIHLPEQGQPAGEVLDCVQVPAFLCRQTDLLVAAARTGKCVNVKKGQFMSPEEMENVVRKIRSAGNANVLLTERGTTFGYDSLVNDFRSVPIMRQLAPVAFDATHSVQQPGGGEAVTGGQRQFVPPLARAAMAAGADALFIETHPEPDKAASDAGSQWPLDDVEALLKVCMEIFHLAREN